MKDRGPWDYDPWYLLALTAMRLFELAYIVVPVVLLVRCHLRGLP